ncbi:MAG: DDE-type integrase/transposase/recombinase [Verrucomicrobia subdivision 3 bacterium]|nr:DDE-type integrase/transposase/recombinase [Limisphaerales bacterium]
MNDNELVEKKKKSNNTSPPRGGAPKNFRRTFAQRLQAVKLHLEEGFSQQLVAQQMDISKSSLGNWVLRYRLHGEEALKDQDDRASARKLPAAVRDKILELKRQEPSRGVKRISQLLRRIFFLPASAETVRQTLKKEGLVESPPKARRNLTRPRFFERATPNQMWQTDIFTFRLGGKYAYLIGFMDDYSRFIVGADLFRSHTAENVLEVFRVAAGEYQPPKEMLTDNGREYINWRGTTRFQAEMKKNGTHHFKSRPHHPMTLGKIERFWETIWQEFLSRAQFDSFESARERIRFWIKYYNHKRPHQGIEGLCPADRFFEIATQLRKTIEAGVQENLLEMALRGQPKAPFYMVGRMEGQSVILRAEKGKLKLSIDNGNENKELIYDLKHDQTSSSASSELHGDGKSPGSPGGVDRPVQAVGSLPATSDQVHDLPALAAPGDGGNAPGAGVQSQSGQGRSPESAPAGPPEQSSQNAQHPENLDSAGADPACAQGGGCCKTAVDDSLPKASQPDPASPSGSDHGAGGGPAVGHLTPGVLQVGETSAGCPASIPGGPAQGATSGDNGPGEGTVAEPGAGTGKEGSAL